MRNAAATAQHVWERTTIGWHVAFAGFALVSGMLVVVDGDANATRKTVALVPLGALCVWYAATGARALNAEPRRRLGMLYLAVAGPVTIALYAVAPPTAMMLFALYPQIWALLSAGTAIWATVVTTVAIGAEAVVPDLLGHRGVSGTTLVIAAGLPMALVLGLWISKIIEQSKERARLVAELAATRSELAEVSHEAGVLAERERLARDLHDTLAQASTSVLLLLQAARSALPRDSAACGRHLDLAEQTARENLAEIRALVAALTPAPLDGVTLPAALRRLTDRIGRELGIKASMSIVGESRELPRSAEVTLLRVTQEALANVRRHAAAGSVGVELSYGGDRVTLRVRDDGRGFDPATPSGYGLDGLRSRVRDAGGELALRTAVGAGVTVSVSLPVEPA